MLRYDLTLITCGNTRYVIKNSELRQCNSDDNTYLCPKGLLATVSSPHWLGAKWTPRSKLSFSHAHLPVSNCLSLRPVVHLGGRFYVATNTTIVSIQHSNGTSLLTLLPLHVYHFPCDFSFNLQATGLTNCPSRFSYQFPLFHNAQFHFVPWQTVPVLNDTLILNSNFVIPQPLRLDNQTLQSLDETNNILDLDYTCSLESLNNAINNIHEVSESVSLSLFVYGASAFTGFNFIVLCFMSCVL